jgi:hypothetical protein
MFPTAMDKSIDINDTMKLAVFVHVINTELNINEETAALMPMKVTTIGAHLCEGVKKVLLSLNTPKQKPGGLARSEVSTVVRRNNGMSSFITNIMKNTTTSNLICHCLIHQDYMCAKPFKM